MLTMNATQPITTVTEANKICADWVRANVDLDAAIAVGNDRSFYPDPNKETPAVFTMPSLGTWRGDCFMGEFEVLVEVATEDLIAIEGEWDIALQYTSTQKYIQWAKDGREAPPIAVVFNESLGRLVSMNRRRWLAAREAGVKLLKCWYSPNHPQHPARSAYWLPECSSTQLDKLNIIRRDGDDVDLTQWFDPYVLNSFKKAELVN